MICPFNGYKLLPKLEKGKFMTYSDYGLGLRDITWKLSHHHSPINVFLKNFEKTGNYHQKEGYDCKRKNTASTTKGTLITMIKENNHSLHVSKPLKLH